MERIDIVEYIVNDIIPIFSRQVFFKGKDMSDWIPFIIAFLYEKEIYVHPIGACWCRRTTKENVEEYMKKNEHLYEEYGEWCEAQR